MFLVKHQKNILLLILCVFAIKCAVKGHEMTKDLLKGNASALQGNYTNAAVEYQNALRAVPSSLVAKRNLGIVLVKIGQFQRSKDILTEVVGAYQSDTDVLYHLGEAYRGLRDYSNANQFYKKALQQNALDLRVVKAYSWSLYKIGQYNDSIELVKTHFKNNPKDLQLKLILAHNLNKIANYEKSIELLKSFELANFKIYSLDKVTADAERALLLTALADAYAGVGQTTKAVLLYKESLKNRPFLVPALVGAAKCDIRQNKLSEAKVKLEKAVKADSNSTDAHLLLSKVYEKSDPQRAKFYHSRYLLLSSAKPML